MAEAPARNWPAIAVFSIATVAGFVFVSRWVDDRWPSDAQLERPAPQRVYNPPAPPPAPAAPTTTTTTRSTDRVVSRSTRVAQRGEVPPTAQKGADGSLTWEQKRADGSTVRSTAKPRRSGPPQEPCLAPGTRWTETGSSVDSEGFMSVDYACR